MDIIIAQHNDRKLTGISGNLSGLEVADYAENPVRALLQLAEKFPQSLLVWVRDDVSSLLDERSFPTVFRHKKVMASFCPNGNFLPDAIGYVEDSFFIDVQKGTPFPTWQMSSVVGGIFAKTLTAAASGLPTGDTLDYFLTSVAKLAMPQGLFCYSDPRLLNGESSAMSSPATDYTLFRFVGEHYKKVWIALLWLNMVCYEKKWVVLPPIIALFHKRRRFDKKVFDTIQVQRQPRPTLAKTLDVLIPTFGRKKYLYDFLKDLSAQTVLPKTVIIVEQNPIPASTSELDYLENESWPFQIKHLFVHRTGACHARNLALEQVTSDWIFFADDDIRIDPDFIASSYNEIYANGMDVYNLRCITKDRAPLLETVHQTSIFGLGCSIVSTKSVRGLEFNPALEFGFGEDSDFGNQLIRKGYDICYLPNPIITHLKAPSGGFRERIELPWERDPLSPKPSPTVFLFRLLNNSKPQLLGYRTVLFFKFYRLQKMKNPFAYRRLFAKMWQRSEYWARRINNEKNGRPLKF